LRTEMMFNNTQDFDLNRGLQSSGIVSYRR
jgi:hypothetical protein